VALTEWRARATLAPGVYGPFPVTPVAVAAGQTIELRLDVLAHNDPARSVVLVGEFLPQGQTEWREDFRLALAGGPDDPRGPLRRGLTTSVAGAGAYRVVLTVVGGAVAVGLRGEVR
jgi:hypothetical protein